MPRLYFRTVTSTVRSSAVAVANVTGRNRLMISMFVCVCRDSGSVRNPPPPASASGISSWSASRLPTGTSDAR